MRVNETRWPPAMDLAFVVYNSGGRDSVIRATRVNWSVS